MANLLAEHPPPGVEHGPCVQVLPEVEGVQSYVRVGDSWEGLVTATQSVDEVAVVEVGDDLRQPAPPGVAEVAVEDAHVAVVGDTGQVHDIEPCVPVSPRGFRRDRVDRRNENAERLLVLVPKPPVVGESDVRHQQHDHDAEQHCGPLVRLHARPPLKGSRFWISHPTTTLRRESRPRGRENSSRPRGLKRLRSPRTAHRARCSCEC